ncbi:unnamed protein product, partial [Mesorhabditis belari]|uniref:Uncharacterized protein n=1 Tax=Mesorhabditis belari TaxID=2138241 RepID=A0AAF3J4H8_9BILA
MYLLNSLHFYTTVLTLVQLCVHLIYDGIFSMALWTAWALIILSHHQSRLDEYEKYRNSGDQPKSKSLINQFSLSTLCLMRMILLSLQTPYEANGSCMFIGYVVLLCTFTQECAARTTIRKKSISTSNTPTTATICSSRINENFR